jgi:hypothetical protein
LGLFNVANTKPSDLPISNAVTNALYQYAQLTNPSFNGVVSMQGLKLYGVAGGSPLFDSGNIQHHNRLKFAITSSFTTPSDLETKFIIDSTAIYMKAETFCFNDITFSAGVNGLISSMVGLGNVANTAPSDLPVSTAQLTALNLKANLASPTFTGTVAGITATMVGLGNVNNTSDANKPVSTATTTALHLKANLASPIITGTLQVDEGITKIINIIDPAT